MLIGAGVGWWKQDVLKDAYEFRVVMGSTHLTTERERALKVGDEFAECKKGCPTMVVIPAGKFTMGAPDDELRAAHKIGVIDDRDKPAHEVTIAKPFAVGKFDVTFAEWDACVEAGASPPGPDNGWGRGNRPVINVSWDQAKVYTAWLSRLTGSEYRLLSETEWEYSARAGTTTIYYWGDDVGKGNANCGECGGQWEDQFHTSPVGSFKPNAFGLYDMAGNVYQWVEDTYHELYDEPPNDGSAWIEGGEPNTHVARGGSWNSQHWNIRTDDRSKRYTVTRSDIIGFRLARTLAVVDYDHAIADYRNPHVYLLRADTRVKKSEYDEAIADYSEAIRLDPKSADAYRDRGQANFYKGDFTAAADDLLHAETLADDAYEQRPYMMLWRFLALGRHRQDGAAELADNAGRLRTKDWPYPVLEFYLGRRTQDGLVSAAENADQRCEATFYIAEWQLLHNQRGEAATALHAAADTCPDDFIEHDGAVAELKRLEP
jgi:formylglycine-generating enzyme required for sulfatase activity/lipoprotein NlpI